MNPGKITCDILKKIRSEIAEANQIEYRTDPCTFKGECLGTCPKCEAELIELEHQLAKKQGFPKTALIAGVTLSLLTGVTSCDTKTTSQEKEKLNEVKDSITNIVSSPKEITTPTIVENGVKSKFRKKINLVPLEIPIFQIVNMDTNSVVFSQHLDSILNKKKSKKNFDTDFVLTRAGGIAFISPYNPDQYNNIMDILNHDYHIDDKSSTPQFEFQDEYLGAYISKFVKIPENKNFEKKSMVVQLLINKEGTIKDVTILKSVDPEIDRQVRKIFEAMPKWVPGRDPNGTVIDTQVKLKLSVTKEGIKVKKLTYEEVKIIL
jgi:hypothetical protein